MKFHRFSPRLPLAGASLLAGLLLIACDRGSAPQDAEPTADEPAAAPDGMALLPSAAQSADARPLFVCPMHPQIQQDAPGTCPICGMRLVERRPAAEATTAAAIDSAIPLAFDAGRLQRLGVRLTPAGWGELQVRARAAAEVVALPGDALTVEARTAGWVETLRLGQPGRRVERGQVLAELYLPEAEALRAELALEPALAAGARERLRRLGVAARDIEAMGEGRLSRRLPLRAPQAGVVAAIEVVQGSRVEPGQALFRIERGGQRWIEARLPVPVADALTEGVAEARLHLGGTSPPRVLEGEWQRSARIDARTQTVAWRLPIGADADDLAVGRYVEVELLGPRRPPQLLVPRSAVLRHADEDRVIARDAQGRLSLRRVRLGAGDGAKVEVLGGLIDGDEVVVRAQFLIEAEAEIDGLLQRWDAASAGHRGHGHD